MTTVLDCIERIPHKLTTMLYERKKRMYKLEQYIQGQDINEIVFVASGSSYNAAMATSSFFERLGLSVRYVYPNIFVNYTNQFNSKALYIFISQGGKTKLVFKSLQKIKALGYNNIAITAHEDAPIAKIADISIEMGCDDEEFMYRTIGYSTTVVTCYQIALTITNINHCINEEKIEEYENDFAAMIKNLPVIKERTLTWYQKHRFSLMHKDHMMFAGTHDLWAVCQEADIKVMEMVPLISRSFELEEFIHGPQNAFDNTIMYFIFARKGEDDKKVNAIAQFLKKEIGFCCIVGNLAKDSRDLYFDVESQYFSALEYVTVAQVIAYKLATDYGRDLSRPLNAKINDYIKKTL